MSAIHLKINTFATNTDYPQVSISYIDIVKT